MKHRIIEIIEQCCALDERVTPESLFKDISVDSLSFVQLAVDLEDAFGVEFEDEKLNVYAWESVGDLIAYLEGKVNGEI